MRKAPRASGHHRPTPTPPARATTSSPRPTPATPARATSPQGSFRSLFSALALAFTSCSGAPSPLAPVASPTGAREAPLSRVSAPMVDDVILVTIDGVRWQEIFDGLDPALAAAAGMPRTEHASARDLTPHLHRLFFDGGTVLGNPHLGAPLAASGPHFVSLPSYVEMMTGAVSGCLDNDCQPAIPWTIASEIASLTPEQGASVFASWSAVSRTLLPTANLTTSTGRPQGESYSAHPGHGDYRPDSHTAAAALRSLAERRPGFLWIALGDTDEWAHRRDYRGYIEALRFADAFIGDLVDTLPRASPSAHRTAIFVTADHGRDRNFADHGGPDSAPVWLMARGPTIPPRGPIGLRTTRHLRDLAPTIATLYGLTPRTCPTCGTPLTDLL